MSNAKTTVYSRILNKWLILGRLHSNNDGDNNPFVNITNNGT